MVVGVALALGLAVYLHFWQVSSIDTSGLRARPPRVSEPPQLDDGSPHDVPCPSAQEQDVQPIETTLCDVLSRPQDFACRRIRFRATLLTDCIHGAALIDNRCERGITPIIVPNVNPAVGAFFRSACDGRPINFDVKMAATFTGRFRLRLRDQATVYVVEIQTLGSVRITPGRRERRRNAAIACAAANEGRKVAFSYITDRLCTAAGQFPQTPFSYR
jgi:hypothetical protein